MESPSQRPVKHIHHYHHYRRPVVSNAPEEATKIHWKWVLLALLVLLIAFAFWRKANAMPVVVQTAPVSESKTVLDTVQIVPANQGPVQDVGKANVVIQGNGNDVSVQGDTHYHLTVTTKVTVNPTKVVKVVKVVVVKEKNTSSVVPEPCEDERLVHEAQVRLWRKAMGLK